VLSAVAPAAPVAAPARGPGENSPKHALCPAQGAAQPNAAACSSRACAPCERHRERVYDARAYGSLPFLSSIRQDPKLYSFAVSLPMAYLGFGSLLFEAAHAARPMVAADIRVTVVHFFCVGWAGEF
jgi:hypothetical protein